ncbi:hypothetical protein BpHYR1_021190 [Brachionus plicatilis]|uniref:Uncharacterized protein n=1 Tax=Brachionus plicatilis TaxID=10195 RepID=A0A3M7TB13_BRAPC|nr:hypothetical protein BpHYR1_021190 [Brachionus plicatilis]
MEIMSSLENLCKSSFQITAKHTLTISLLRMLLRSKKLTFEYLVKDKGKRKCKKAINLDNSLNDAESIDKPQEQNIYIVSFQSPKPIFYNEKENDSFVIKSFIFVGSKFLIVGDSFLFVSDGGDPLKFPVEKYFVTCCCIIKFRRFA